MMKDGRVATGLEALQAIAAARTYDPVVVCAPGSLNPQGDPMWRVGNHYGIHVYEGDRPVATFHTVLDAEMAVAAFNNRTLVEISEDVLARCAHALHAVTLDQSTPTLTYARAVVAALIEQGIAFTKAPPAMLPVCTTHDPVQHRDGKPAWCENCGLTADYQTPVSHIALAKEKRT